MDRDRLYAALAKHILLDLKGIDLLRAVSDMKVARLETKLVDIARELERRGIHVPESGTHISSMREWLEAAKVLDGQWGVNEDKLRDLIGHGLDQIDEMGQFSPEQRAFVEALAAMPGDGPFNSAEVARLATAQHNVVYDPKNLRYQVLFPLRDSGYLEVTKTTAGRGAKPYMVKPSSKFNREFIVPVLQALAKAASVPPDILRRSLSEIVADLSSPKKDVKGKALEILAVNVCRILGLQIVGWRLRSNETGGQEVDVIADGTNFVFLRWEIQCKNTKTVSSDDVAREVGVALGNHAGVVLMVTTGRFTEPARKYMNRILQTTAMNVMLLDGSDLKEIVGNPAAAARVLGKHAKRIRSLKRSESIP
jgi:site-specific DNA-methyltransferase (cytosine-N4-specific)